MKASELKDLLKGDFDKIEMILSSLGCHKIWESSRGEEIRCASPDGTNKTSIAVKMNTLSVSYYSEGVKVKDIIGLVEHFKEYSFTDAMRYIKGLLGIGNGNYVKPKEDHLELLRKHRSKRGKIKLSEIEVEKFERTMLNNYIMLPHIELFKEAIMPQIQEQYSIGYDDVLDRIIFPHFSFDNIDKIVGITGRTLASSEMIKEFDIPKYWNYIKGYKKTQNLYGFSHAIENIKECKTMIIFEAEKSVLKQATIERGKSFSVSVGGHDLSDVQVKIITQLTPPDTEIVIAFDKDVMTTSVKDELGNDISGEQYIINICKKLSKYRKVSYIFDKFDLLGEKDSPIDKGYKRWSYLFSKRKEVS